MLLLAAEGAAGMHPFYGQRITRMPLVYDIQEPGCFKPSRAVHLDYPRSCVGRL